MFRKLLAPMLALAAMIPGVASAVAHHEQVVVQKLRDPSTKQVIGARIHMIVDPETYNRVRVNIGKLTISPADKANDTMHRETAAGLRPGYVRAQIADLQNLNLKAGQTTYHELQEVRLDVKYGDMNDLKPGEKVDIYTTYNNPKASYNQLYWHVFGMHDGPVNKGDLAHVHELPSDTSAHGEATEFPE